MKPHGFHREALQEYKDAASRYAAISPALGWRFVGEIERLIAEICRNPDTYRRVQGSIRRHFSAKFPFGIIYDQNEDRVRILAVMPLRRNPDYWLKRTE